MKKSCQSEMFCACCSNDPLFKSLHPIRTQTFISAARKTQKYVTEHQMTLNLYVTCHISLDYVIIQLSYKVQRTSKMSNMLQQPVRKQSELFFSPPRNMILNRRDSSDRSEFIMGGKQIRLGSERREREGEDSPPSALWIEGRGERKRKSRSARGNACVVSN